LPVGHTVAAMARLLQVDPAWIYRGLRRGCIRMGRDPHFGCYLFPRTRAAVLQMKQLRRGSISQVSFLQEHCDG
jgi:hypothetical protein